MSFKPANQNEGVSNTPQVNWSEINKQVRGGSRPARVSLIVDLGTQKRDNFEEDYKADNAKHIKALAELGATVSEVDGKQVISIPQKPQPQVAVFVDLTSDVVDYGSEIGKQPYRLMVNKSFMGNVEGIGFAGTYSFDNKGNVLKDKGYTFHSNSVLTKLANATGQKQIVAGSGKDNMDVSQLLGHPVMISVDKTETPEGKVYLNYKGCSSVPMVPSDPSDPDSEEVLMNVKPLTNEAIVITFDNITAENKKFLRGDIIKKIKSALNYEGSVMQQVLEAKAVDAPVDNVDDDSDNPPAPQQTPAGFDSLDDSIPFMRIMDSHVLCI